jgi:hypothetical protein
MGGASRPFRRRKGSVGVHESLERGEEGGPPGRRRLARVVRRVESVGADSAAQNSFGAAEAIVPAVVPCTLHRSASSRSSSREARRAPHPATDQTRTSGHAGCRVVDVCAASCFANFGATSTRGLEFFACEGGPTSEPSAAGCDRTADRTSIDAAIAHGRDADRTRNGRSNRDPGPRCRPPAPPSATGGALAPGPVVAPVSLRGSEVRRDDDGAVDRRGQPPDFDPSEARCP